MKQLCLILLICALFSACTKEGSNEFIADPSNPQNDTTWSSSINNNSAVNQLIDMLTLPYQVDSFDIEAGGHVYWTNGQLGFNSNCTAQPIKGKVKVEYIYLKSKGDMVRSSKPTTSSDRILVSGGAFFIKVSQGASVFQMAGGARLNIKYQASLPEAGMQLFYGDTTKNSNDGFTWVPATGDSTQVNTWQYQDSTLLTGYEMFPSKFGWINCDKFSDTSMPRTTLIDTLPVNFTNTNTAVFAVFKDQWSVVRLYANAADKYFYAYNMPIGSKITLISLSKIGDDLYLGAKEITVAADKVEGLSPEIASKDKIIAYLKGL